MPIWATLLALMEADEVYVGVVSAPALGRRWWASRGQGAWLSVFGGPPRRLHVSGVTALADASMSHTGGGWADAPGGRDHVKICLCSVCDSGMGVLICASAAGA